MGKWGQAAHHDGAGVARTTNQPRDRVENKITRLLVDLLGTDPFPQLTHKLLSLPCPSVGRRTRISNSERQSRSG